MRTVDRDERRARLVTRHHLSKPAPDVDTAAASLFGLHSTDPVTVYLSAWARVSDFEVPDLEDALYVRRSLLRMLGMRRTLFVLPVDHARVMNAACSQALVPPERKRLLKMITDASMAKSPEHWLAGVEKRTLAALEARGEATAKELTQDVPELAGKFHFGEGKKWAGSMSLATRMMILLAMEGRIVRGRPLGTWVSSQYRYVPATGWIDGGLAEVDPQVARAELARHWLRAFGPGTVHRSQVVDGLDGRQTEAALSDGRGRGGRARRRGRLRAARRPRAGPGAQSVGCGVAGLDATVMGWKERAWYLGDHRAEAVRHERERRPDHLGRRADRRGLEPAQGR